MANITRTFYRTSGLVKVWDGEKHDVVTVAMDAFGKYDAEEFKKEVSRRETRPVLEVEDVYCEEQIKGMTQTEFLKFGTVYTERSKDNRGMISKTVKTSRFYVKVWDNVSRSVIDTVVSADTEKGIVKNLPGNYKLLEVTDRETVTALVCMEVNTFWKYGHEMSDHHHYVG